LRDNTGGIYIQTEPANLPDFTPVAGEVDYCCEGCGARVDRAGLAGRRSCPECGGGLVGIRVYKNPLTRKVLYAERVDL
jgi:hypothetical protein